MRCSKCGSELQNVGKFCPICGNKLNVSYNNEFQETGGQKDTITKEDNVSLNLNKSSDTSKQNNKKKKSADYSSLLVKGVLGLFAVVAVTVFFLFNPFKDEQSALETDVDANEATSSEDTPEERITIKDVLGYWSNDEYNVYLSEETLYIQNLMQSSYEEYAYAVSKDNETDIVVRLISNNEIDGESYIIETSEELYLSIENENLIFNQSHEESDLNLNLLPQSENQMDDSFLSLIESSENVEDENSDEGQEKQVADFTFDDFIGYWFPFDTYDVNKYSMGQYGFYIGEGHTILAYMESEVFNSELRDYTIEENTISFWEYELDGSALMDLEYDPNAIIERSVVESHFTLFKEENGRDRLVIHRSGVVLQKVTEEEISTTQLREGYDASYPLFGKNHIEVIDELSEQYNQLNSNQLVEHLYPIEDVKLSIKIENYPYSLGALSEEQLKAENEIINGQVSHPETVTGDIAIDQLLNGSFESTPSYKNITHFDMGYYFYKNGSEDDYVGFVTLGSGGRTKWASAPANGDIGQVEFHDHIYTVHYSDDSMMDDNTERFYRIDENIIYTQDENGDFTLRFEKDTDWNDFQGLPDRAANEGQ